MEDQNICNYLRNFSIQPSQKKENTLTKINYKEIAHVSRNKHGDIFHSKRDLWTPKISIQNVKTSWNLIWMEERSSDFREKKKSNHPCIHSKLCRIQFQIWVRFKLKFQLTKHVKRLQNNLK